MKTKLFQFVTLVIFFFSCNTSPENEKRFLSESRPVTIPDDLKQVVKSEHIGVRSTAKLSAFFMNANNSFRNLATQMSYGGIFNAAAFKISNGNNAVRLWYCLNPNNKTYPPFFLAVEQIIYTDDTKEFPEDKPAISDELKIPEVFLYPISDVTESDRIEAFITRHDTDRVGAMTIPKKEVLEYAENFKFFMNIISPADPKSYCKYAVAIFENNSDYDNFMKREGGLTFVRYYMGLSYDPGHEPNYLRPILAGVRADGTTVTETGDKNIGPFLQKSVPPPPHE